MIKLKQILNEIEIGIPLSKQEIVDWFIKNEIDILQVLTESPTFKDFLAYFGARNLEDWLEDEENFGSPQYAEEIVNHIDAYYDRFKPNEIKVKAFGETFTDDSGKAPIIKSSIPYKNIEIIRKSKVEYYLYCNNF
jgi:hypothetical protein